MSICTCIVCVHVCVMCVCVCYVCVCVCNLACVTAISPSKTCVHTVADLSPPTCPVGWTKEVGGQEVQSSTVTLRHSQGLVGGHT